MKIIQHLVKSQFGAWANKVCRAADKRAICKKPVENPSGTPAPIIDHDDIETNEKFCGSSIWRYYPEGNKCIHYSAFMTKWEDQQKYCSQNNGKLIAINSPGENESIIKDLRKDPVNL